MDAPKGKKVTFSIDLTSFSLEQIYQRYIAHVKDGLNEEQIESLRGCFFSGASAVLSIFDQVTFETLNAEDKAQELHMSLGANHPSTIQAMQNVDIMSGQLVALMTCMMQEVCDGIGVPNTAHVIGDYEGVQELMPKKTKQSTGAEVFDLSTWQPKDTDKQ